jgi:NAD(P)H-hydrate epimerase
MMRIATIDEAKKIDQLSQESIGSELLMESAGALAAREIRAYIEDQKIRSNGRVAVVCGPGGNGADGLVCARHLASSGLDVAVYLFDSLSENELFKQNLKRLPSNVERRTPGEISEIAGAALVVDALLGLGTSRNVHGVMKLFIEEMNRSIAPTISLDLPSGLDADRGISLGIAVQATMTLTFGLAKRGFFVSEGPRHVGRLKVVPIGFPIDIVRETAKTQSAFGEKSARRRLPKRRSSSNKSTNGRTAVFAGRPGFIGAGLLAGLGAMRAGSGYVTLVTHLSEKDQKAKSEIASVAPEFLTLASDDKDVWEKTEGAAAIVGPGFGAGAATLKILRELAAKKNRSVVVDADALTTLAEEKKAGRELPVLKSWILTPHAGELSRLIGGRAKDHEANRFEAAETAAREMGAIVLFKGFRTVISDGTRSCVVLSGNAALSKAGSGDILSGIIAGFLAQKIEPFEAACLGAYVHGRLADEWLRSGRDILSLQPSDLAQTLPTLLKRLRSSTRSDLMSHSRDLLQPRMNQ